jgi:hypothetical protein
MRGEHEHLARAEPSHPALQNASYDTCKTTQIITRLARKACNSSLRLRGRGAELTGSALLPLPFSSPRTAAASIPPDHALRQCPRALAICLNDGDTTSDHAGAADGEVETLRQIHHGGVGVRGLEEHLGIDLERVQR